VRQRCSATTRERGKAEDVFVEANSSAISGLGGNDRLVAYDGSDTIDGGAGDDYLEGGFGNDVLDGGAGVDQFRGDRIESNVIAVGADQIRARDGNAEQVDCGIGPDTAVVDAGDIVANCETVDRGAVIVDGLPPAKPGRPKLLTKLSVKAISKKGLVLRIACPAACAVTAELRVDKKTARKLKLGKSRVLARVDAARGSPQHPLSPQALRAKVHDLAGDRFDELPGDEPAAELIARI